MDKLKVLNNKLHIRLLPDAEQPKKSIFSPDAEMLKKAEVLDVGQKVTEIEKGQIITLYVNSLYMLGTEEAFCTDRDPIFINGYPREGKVNVGNTEKKTMTSFTKGIALKSSSGDIDDNDVIYFREGQSHILPDNTEIISESQIYFKG